MNAPNHFPHAGKIFSRQCFSRYSCKYLNNAFLKEERLTAILIPEKIYFLDNLSGNILRQFENQILEHQFKA